MLIKRLKKSQDFKEIQKQGTRWSAPAFTIYAQSNCCHVDEGEAIVGFTVSKKAVSKLAVDRNRAKRRIRELTKLLKHAVRSQVGYVIVAKRNALEEDFEKMQQDFLWCLKHIHRQLDEGIE